MKEKSLQAHEKWNGKIEIISRCPVNSKEDLAVAYTPGVSYPCLEIQRDSENSYKYTRRSNLVGVITDGSAVLGLGDIGALAAMPVMEGKCVLFKEFADVDAFPLCINSNDVDKIIETVKLLEGSFGAINLEDISAPRCFEIEERLNEECNIPVFHDDQHGTAIAVLSALLNSMKLVKKDYNMKIVINGAGAAGIAISNLLFEAGFSNIVICDKYGIITSNNAGNIYQKKCAFKFNKNKEGTLQEALVNSDVFIGVSAGNIVTKEMVETMNKDSIIFALANPVPEIMPEVAKKANAKIIATGRSDYSNQINNLLVFPGIIKGALKAGIIKITTEMQLEVAKGIANCIDEKDLNINYIIPSVFDKRVADLVCNIIYSFKK